ncbi:hypothetical protein [Pseudonocardia xishanensis]|uniref:EthD domain-containing protein n=1 Tax=Pseudonocardia xishanensis TaxID=630995 RepID=A0ABP8RYE9_9PSEU
MSEPRPMLMVFTAPVPGREVEYHRWYDEIHLDEILALPGFVGARRYDFSPAGVRGAAEPPTGNLAVYELQGDPAAAVQALVAARATLQLSDALADGADVWLFNPREPKAS